MEDSWQPWWAKHCIQFIYEIHGVVQEMSLRSQERQHMANEHGRLPLALRVEICWETNLCDRSLLSGGHSIWGWGIDSRRTQVVANQSALYNESQWILEFAWWNERVWDTMEQGVRTMFKLWNRLPLITSRHDQSRVFVWHVWSSQWRDMGAIDGSRCCLLGVTSWTRRSLAIRSNFKALTQHYCLVGYCPSTQD